MEKEATSLRKFAGGTMGLNLTRCIALFLVVSVPILRGAWPRRYLR